MNIEIINQDNELWIDSLTVANGFNVDHKNLLETVSKQFTRLKRVNIAGSATGRKKSVVLLTERQIMILPVLVRTTPETIAFQERMVDAFFEMREQLKSNQLALPQNYEQALQKLLETIREKNDLSDYIEENQDKIDYVNNVVYASKDLKTVTGLAQLLNDKGADNIGRTIMFTWFRDNGYTYFDKCNVPFQQYINCGYFVVKDEPWSRGNKNGVYNRMYITPKGKTYFVKKYFDSIKPFQTEIEMSKYK